MSAKFSNPLHLPGATEFSADREILSPLWAVRKLKQTPWLFNDLEASTSLDKGWGRRKDPGHWALAYLAFVVSDCKAAVEKWWADSSDELWRECGFKRRPSYQTTYERFVELESVADEFSAVAGKLIRHCRKQEPLIGAHVHVDSTEAETHAALVHDCEPQDGCMQAGGRKPAQRPRRAPTDTFRTERQREADEEPDDPDVPQIGDADEVKQTPDGRLRIRVGKHWYRTLDSTAGVRAYMGPKGARRFWHGFYCQKAIDHYTGAPLAVGLYNASVQEYYCYPELFSRLTDTLQDTPETIVADKGFSIESVFALNTNNGVASVIPWRKANGHTKRHDKLTHDRHGIPRCKHCGAESKFVRFLVEDKGPRLWFKCANETKIQKTPACDKVQSIACSKDWRLLIPLWRTSPIYHELQKSHQLYERVHRHWRDRYLVAGENLDTRPKRRGIGCQQLRAQAALLIEWLRIADRQGWLKARSERRNHKKPANYDWMGTKGAKGIKSLRKWFEIDLPYGPEAKKLGIGEAEPPSQRPRGAPPGKPPPAAPF